ncbi:MAG TPA: tyrosine--tRNA ligase, partial [Candidatus Acidoferrum sp.]|nr:tyrosine--tRNA ligase [Candidatus Acidoferrum sp.]
DHPGHYMGLEISGMPHIGHLLFGGKKINDLNKIGVKTQVLLADWHTVANRKLDGNWERIKKASEFYRKMFGVFCPGTKIVLGSDLYHDNDDYWKLVMNMAARTTMARATRTLIIQGRSQSDTLHVSQYIYPIMQAADIRALGADIPHAGMDQRRIHMLAKELFKDMKLGTIVPMHHHLMPAMGSQLKFKEGESKEEKVADMKMSKSKPGSFISVIATAEEIRSTVNSAWCEAKITDGNPVLMLCRYAIIPIAGSINVERKKEHGGDVAYKSYVQLEDDFRAGKLHPADLKAAVSRSLDRILEPVRKEFTGRNQELLEVFKQK